MRKRELIAIRPGQPSDMAFIVSTWLKGLRAENKWFGLIDEDIYTFEYRRVIHSILNHRDTTINVAVLVDDPEVILAYAVLGPRTIHWCFTKPDWRRIGLCSDLTGKDNTHVTHLTKRAFKAGMGNLIFNPVLWTGEFKQVIKEQDNGSNTGTTDFRDPAAAV